MAHTHTHLDLAGLTPDQRSAFAFLTDAWLNDAHLAQDIANGTTTTLPMCEIDVPHLAYPKQDLADNLTGFAHFIRGAVDHLEHAARQDACAAYHADWHEPPEWCICGDPRRTTIGPIHPDDPDITITKGVMT